MPSMVLPLMDLGSGAVLAATSSGSRWCVEGHRWRDTQGGRGVLAVRRVFQAAAVGLGQQWPWCSWAAPSHPCTGSGADQSLPYSPPQGAWRQSLGMVPHRHHRAQTRLLGWAHHSKSLKSLAERSSCPAAGKCLWHQLLLGSCSWHPEGRGHCQFSLFHVNLFPLWSLVTGSIHWVPLSLLHCHQNSPWPNVPWSCAESTQVCFGVWDHTDFIFSFLSLIIFLCFHATN